MISTAKLYYISIFCKSHDVFTTHLYFCKEHVKRNLFFSSANLNTQMDPVARKNLNLEVLKRHDANVCDILDQSAHAVVYKFDTEKASWVRR